jgi:hypothetical protein
MFICRVGQNHIHTVYIQYFWLKCHQIYGVYTRIYTVLATLFICHHSNFVAIILLASQLMLHHSTAHPLSLSTRTRHTINRKLALLPGPVDVTKGIKRHESLKCQSAIPLFAPFQGAPACSQVSCLQQPNKTNTHTHTRTYTHAHTYIHTHTLTYIYTQITHIHERHTHSATTQKAFTSYLGRCTFARSCSAQGNAWLVATSFGRACS